MKKKNKINKRQVGGTTPDEIAETYRTIFVALLNKGFTQDQAIQLMLSMAKS